MEWMRTGGRGEVEPIEGESSELPENNRKAYAMFTCKVLFGYRNQLASTGDEPGPTTHCRARFRMRRQPSEATPANIMSLRVVLVES